MYKKLILALVLFILTGCVSAIPIRETLKEDIRIPVGRIEGNRFVGIRYPFKVEVPSPWKMVTDFPDFLKELGYEKPTPEETEQTELYIYNPETKSNIQIDFTPAGRYSEFNQAFIERLTTAATQSFKEEFEAEHGKTIELIIAPTEAVILKGVEFAAKKYVNYFLKGVKREQGWIYGFKEPYQIFILYMIIEKEGFNDREDINRIIDTFEVFQK
jgi:hypothetical protein